MKKLINYILVVFLTVLLGACEGSKKEKQSEETPVTNQQIESDQKEKLYFDLDLDSIKNLTQGETFKISASDSMNFNLSVRRIKETVPGIISVAANIEDRETGLASIIIKEDRASGSLELYKEEKLFQIQYDSLENRHYLEEVDRSEMDILEGSEPIEVPSERDTVIVY